MTDQRGSQVAEYRNSLAEKWWQSNEDSSDMDGEQVPEPPEVAVLHPQTEELSHYSAEAWKHLNLALN